jgi:hypothetical protein
MSSLKTTILKFARHIDSENLFVDDDNDNEVKRERGFVFKDDHEAQHLEIDIKINGTIFRKHLLGTC